jgi:hypothetical protein
MEPQVKAAVISAIATILVAILAKVPLEKALSTWARRRANIPEIMNTQWKAEWSYDDGNPTVVDSVTLEKWTKKTQFGGYGEVDHAGKRYKYSITGEVSPTRVVLLTYKAEKYPTEANIGTAALLLSTSAQDLTGTWSGLEASTLASGTKYELRGGRVRMQRIKG